MKPHRGGRGTLPPPASGPHPGHPSGLGRTPRRLNVLGVDPGTHRIGTAVVAVGPPHRVVQCWSFHLGNGELTDRLTLWAKELAKVLRIHKPGIVVVENPLVTRNTRTVDALSRCVGATTVMARQTGAVVLEYRTGQHRKRSTGNVKRTVATRHLLQRHVRQVPHNVDEHMLDALSLAVTGVLDYLASHSSGV